MTRSYFSKRTDHALSVDQQIDYLRRFGEAWPLRSVALVCVAVMISSVYAFRVSNHEVLKVLLLFLAGVSGLVALAISTQLPGMTRASRATRTGRRIQSTVHLTVDRSDSENVLINGELRDGSFVWKLHFGNAFGWTPQTGVWPCEIVMLSDEPIPALVQLEHGLLFPTRKSRKVFRGSA